jgi:hypothetical protein
MLSDRAPQARRFSEPAMGQINGNVAAARRRDESNLSLV